VQGRLGYCRDQRIRLALPDIKSNRELEQVVY
jgi:hypothetical protein